MFQRWIYFSYEREAFLFEKNDRRESSQFSDFVIEWNKINRFGGKTIEMYFEKFNDSLRNLHVCFELFRMNFHSFITLKIVKIYSANQNSY